MKRLAIAVTVVGALLGGYALTQVGTVEEYIAPEVQVEVKEVPIDALEKQVREAQEAKKSEMEVVAQKAYQDAYDREMTKVEAEVVDTYYKLLGERKIELEKKAGKY